MRPRRVLVATLVAACVAGCSRGGGGGGGGSSIAATISGTATSGSTAAGVDAQLGAALAVAGVTPLTAPAPDSPALVALGRSLYFDKIVSGNQNISCASCHQMGASTGDGLPVAMGEGATGDGTQRTLGTGQLIARNAQALFNSGQAAMDFMFWDGRVLLDPITGTLTTPDFLLNGSSPSRPAITAELTSALAAQAMFPPTVAQEMLGQPGNNPLAGFVLDEDIWAGIMARLVGTSNGTVGGITAYRSLFAAAFPSVTDFDDLSFGHAAQAIAAFERASFTAVNSPFDQYVNGNLSALSDSQKQGALLFFGAANCSSCHDGPLLTDMQFHALAVPQVGPGKDQANEDLGRALITGLATDDYRFRTPPLRNVAQTGPWMHDGAYTTLEGAVRHHLDPASAILSYDASQLPPLFAATVDTDAARIAARIAAIDPLLGAPLALSDTQVAELLDFLNALTDPGSLSLQQYVPASVPSGLPIPD